MGIHSYIKELEPIVLYTFDPRESFLDVEKCTGFYVNATETDFPPLELKNSGIYLKEPFLNFNTPALSYIEYGALYKSFSTSSGHTVAGSYINPLTSVLTNYSFKNGSLYAEADFEDQISFTEEPYTIFFQMKSASLSSSVTSIQPYILYVDDIITASYFGIRSVCEFEIGNFFLYDIVSGFGYSSYVTSYEEEILPQCSFGYTAETSISYNPNGIYNEVEFDEAVNIFYDRTYASAIMDDTYFQFRHIKLKLINSTILTDDNVGTTVSYNQNKIVNVFIEHDPIEQKTMLYLDKGGASQLFTSHPFSDNVIRIGYKSGLRRQTLLGYELLSTNIADTPKLNVSFDNFAIYPRKLTKHERIKMFDLNREFSERYISYGYNQLYTFESLYDAVSRRYIENDTLVPNILGTSYLRIKSSNKNNMPYVYRRTDSEIEYVFHNTSHSMITVGRSPTTNFHISMLRSDTKTLSFKFSTTDSNGVLFACGDYNYTSSNFSFIMNGGTLEIWAENEYKVGITGMNNGDWNSIHVLFDTSSTKFYVNQMLYHTITRSIKPSINTPLHFGSSIPGNSLECDLSLIGCSQQLLSNDDINTLKENTILYSAYGQITINNVPIGTKIYVYNRYDGKLIEKIISDEVDGTFKYVNKTPYVLTVIVSDSGYLNGRAYIVDPIEIK